MWTRSGRKSRVRDDLRKQIEQVAARGQSLRRQLQSNRPLSRFFRCRSRSVNET
jgi:hypothetical protein